MHSVWAQFHISSPKRLIFFLLSKPLEQHRLTLLPSLGVQLSGEVPFVIFEWLVWELPPDNQRVSNSLFERSPIIIVVGFTGTLIYYWMLTFSKYPIK